MKYISSVIFVLFSCLGFGQTTEGLVAYYPFDGCDFEDAMGSYVTTVGGSPACICGAVGDGIELDGTNDFLDFQGDYERFFLGDFTISFYFLPRGNLGNQDLLSFRVGCNIDSVLALSYSAPAQEFVIELFQNINRNEIIVAPIEDNACWQHVVFVKKEKVLTLFLNGERVAEEENTQIIGVQNKGTLSISNSTCLGISQQRFEGGLDELRIYDRAIELAEALDLYTRPDNILNPDTTILLGAAVDIEISQSCADSYSWSPNFGVANTSDPSTSLSPQNTTLYTLTFNLGACSITDDIQITVVDPENLDCNEVFIPKAFTPNGDGLNEEFGISNAYVFDRLVSFEIFSSWGEKVFETSDGFGTWDGNYKGGTVEPGVFVYKIVYICSGQEFNRSGSFSVLR